MDAMLDNVHVAILIKVNELAERCGFTPVGFVATIRDDETGLTVLTYETLPDRDAATNRKFDAMLNSIGVHSDGTLVGSPEDIYLALSHALAKMPTPRLR